MGCKNNKGQILVELSVVMLFVFLVLIAALPRLAEQTKTYKQYQFTNKSAKDKGHGKKDHYSVKR